MFVTLASAKIQPRFIHHEYWLFNLRLSRLKSSGGHVVVKQFDDPNLQDSLDLGDLEKGPSETELERERWAKVLMELENQEADEREWCDLMFR
jgi:hypothetical protein